MINLNKIKIKNSNYMNALYLDEKSSFKSNDLAPTKHYPPTNKEWFNSIYSYNKNYIKSLPITDKIVNNLLKSYFHLTSSLEKSKLKSKNMRIRNKRLSANRIYLSRAEMKHTNNKVIITLYTYNRTIFCNGLTIIRKNIWINKNVSIIKKSFYSGIINLSRRFIFSKIFTNIINPFDGLEKKRIKIKQKNLYIIQLIQNLLINKILSRKLNKLTNKLSKLTKNFIFNSKSKIQSTIGNYKLIKNEVLYVYKNLIEYSIYKYSILHKLYSKSFVKYQIFKKLYIPKNFLIAKKNTVKYVNLDSQKNKLKPIDNLLFIVHNNLTKNINYYRSIIKKLFSFFQIHSLTKLKANNKNRISLVNNDSKSIVLYNTIYSVYKYNTYKVKRYIKQYLIKNLTQKILYKNILNLNSYINENIKNTKFYNNKFNFYFRDYSKYYKRRYNFLNFTKIASIFKNQILFENDKKINLKNTIHDKVTFKVFKKIVGNFNNYVNKVYKVNLKKFAYIFEALNIKNPIFSSYYFIQIYKKSKFIKYNREILSIKKILDLKIDYKKLIRKIKLIKNSRIVNILQKTNFNTLVTDKSISSNTILNNNTLSPITELIYSPQYKIINPKFILMLQSNNILRKKLNIVLPLYIYYVQMIYINNYKYKNWFLYNLKHILYNIYKKKVEFNIVNLKYIHLNSDMLSESMAVKLRNRKNRILKVLNRVLRLIKVSSIHTFLKDKISNSYFNNYETLKMYSNLTGKKMIMKRIINSIKYKKISGVRLEAAGRLTKRLTASRSIHKLKHKGSLKNIDSSYKNISSVVLRGYMKPNLQYTQINSKTRNGAFGLKTWISG